MGWLAVEEEVPVVENPDILVIHADDVLSAEVEGDRLVIVMYAFRKMCGRRVKWPVLEIRRPITGIRRASKRIWSAVGSIDMQ